MEGLVAMAGSTTEIHTPGISHAGGAYSGVGSAGPVRTGIDEADWKGKRVFVTGHTGFKGSWLSLWLRQLGAVVRGYSLAPPTDPSLYEVAAVGECLDSVIADIRDTAKLRAEMVAFRPEVIFHLAAQSLVRYSYANPLDTYAVNVLGTANLLDAVRSCNSVKAVVIVTTDKCYENQEWPWPYRETDRLGGHDPYSNSKACAELVTSSFRDSYFPSNRYPDHGVAIATARAGNVIGGGDWAADRLIPDMVRALAVGLPVQIRNPASVRPWQHVLEPLRGYLMLATALLQHGVDFASAWNFGPRDLDAKPVIEIAQRMTALWNQPRNDRGTDRRDTEATFQVDEGLHLHEAAQLRLDWSKAATHLHWSPLLGIDEALTLTAEWYAAWRSGESVRPYTLNQIEAHNQQAVAK